MFAPDSYETTLTTVTPLPEGDYAYVITVAWEWTEARYVVSTPVDLSALSFTEVFEMITTLTHRDEGGRVLAVTEF